MFKKQWLLSIPTVSSVNEAVWMFSVPLCSPQAKNPIHLLLDLAGRENGLCRYGAVILPFLVLETEDVTKTDVADV